MKTGKIIPFRQEQEGISQLLIQRIFEKEKRPSVESFSIDVIGTLQNLGKTSRVARRLSDSFGYYGIILVE